jgi:hypothetical protein
MHARCSNMNKWTYTWGVNTYVYTKNHLPCRYRLGTKVTRCSCMNKCTHTHTHTHTHICMYVCMYRRMFTPNSPSLSISMGSTGHESCSNLTKYTYTRVYQCKHIPKLTLFVDINGPYGSTAIRRILKFDSKSLLFARKVCAQLLLEHVEVVQVTHTKAANHVFCMFRFLSFVCMCICHLCVYSDTYTYIVRYSIWCFMMVAWSFTSNSRVCRLRIKWFQCHTYVYVYLVCTDVLLLHRFHKIHTYTHTYVHTYIHTHIHIYVCIYIYIYIYMYIHIHIYVCMYVYIYIYICMYVCMYVCISCHAHTQSAR